MQIASMPIAVVMQRRKVNHPWADPVWEPAGVLRNPGNLPEIQLLQQSESLRQYLVSGVQLELHRDENDGYFENWAAPEPKVFLMWRVQDELARPVTASVSYSEGARMMDSGELAGGVNMPRDIYDWLTEYLLQHYQPRPKRGREHG